MAQAEETGLVEQDEASSDPVDDFLRTELVIDGFQIGLVLKKEMAAGARKLDTRGHFHGYRSDWFAESIMEFFLMPSGQMKLAIEILKNRAEGKNDRRHAVIGSDTDRLVCNSCAQDVKIRVTKKKLKATTECPHPNGYPAYSVRVNVPSGKLIFGNDFRDLVRIAASYDVNRERGTHQTTQAYADHGMIHVFVGNTCPGIYRVNDSRINIVSPEGASDAEGNDLPTKKPKGEVVGSICTDLWWYSAMDYDLFKKLAKERRGKEWKKRISQWETVVKVKPGCYEITCQTHRVRERGHTTADGGYYHAEEMFSFIKRVGKVRELPSQSNYRKTYEFSLNFENAIKLKRLAWSTLYRRRAQILEQWFCVTGGGDGWHDGAMVSISGREEDAMERLLAGEEVTWEEEGTSKLEQLEARLRPELVGQHRSYYPISEEYAGLCTVPDNVRPDWLAGVREMLRLIEDNGCGPREDANYKRNVRNVKIARKVRIDLDKRFGQPETD